MICVYIHLSLSLLVNIVVGHNMLSYIRKPKVPLEKTANAFEERNDSNVTTDLMSFYCILIAPLFSNVLNRKSKCTSV